MNRVSELIHTQGHEVHRIGKEASFTEAAREFLDKEVSALLVYDGTEVAGIFTKNDLVRSCCAQGPEVGDRLVGSAMSTNLFSVPPDAEIEDVLAEMVRDNRHHVPVMDGGKAVGMLTPLDILLHQKDTMAFKNQELVRYITGSY